MAKKKRLKLGDKVKVAYWTEQFRDRGTVIGLSPGEAVVVLDQGDGNSLRMATRFVKRL